MTLLRLPAAILVSLAIGCSGPPFVADSPDSPDSPDSGGDSEPGFRPDGGADAPPGAEAAPPAPDARADAPDASPPAPDAGRGDSSSPGDGGPDGAVADCVATACDAANPGYGGANCGVLAGVLCDGAPVDCSAWQGAPPGGCSSILPATDVCGGSGVPNSCGDECLSTVPFEDGCETDSVSPPLPDAWAVSSAFRGTPYRLVGGSPVWRTSDASTGCVPYDCSSCEPAASILCCSP